MSNTKPEGVKLDVKMDENRNKGVETTSQKTKAKNARLRLMKECNENYLAEQREEKESDAELTKELRVTAGD